VAQNSTHFFHSYNRPYDPIYRSCTMIQFQTPSAVNFIADPWPLYLHAHLHSSPLLSICFLLLMCTSAMLYKRHTVKPQNYYQVVSSSHKCAHLQSHQLCLLPFSSTSSPLLISAHTVHDLRTTCTHCRDCCAHCTHLLGNLCTSFHTCAHLRTFLGHLCTTRRHFYITRQLCAHLCTLLGYFCTSPCH
jgi:hypothetical protein